MHKGVQKMNKADLWAVCLQHGCESGLDRLLLSLDGHDPHDLGPLMLLQMCLQLLN